MDKFSWKFIWTSHALFVFVLKGVHCCVQCTDCLELDVLGSVSPAPIFCSCFLTAEFGRGVSLILVYYLEKLWSVHLVECLECFCNPGLGCQSSTRCHCCCSWARSNWPFLQQKFWVVSVNMSIHVTLFCDGKMNEAALVSVIKNKCKS